MNKRVYSRGRWREWGKARGRKNCQLSSSGGSIVPFQLVWEPLVVVEEKEGVISLPYVELNHEMYLLLVFMSMSLLYSNSRLRRRV